MPKISELYKENSPSASAVLVGVVEKEVDGELTKETVQIPISKFVQQTDEGEMSVRGIAIRDSYGYARAWLTLDENYRLVIESEEEFGIRLKNLQVIEAPLSYDLDYIGTGDDGMVLRTDGETVYWGYYPVPSLDGYVKKDSDGVINSNGLSINGSDDAPRGFVEFDNEGYLAVTTDGAEGIKLENVKKIIAPDSDGSELMGEGKEGQVLMSNGQTVFWGNPPSGGTSSGGSSIIYATELPSTPQQAVYVVTQDEVVKAEIAMGGSLTPEYSYVEIVDVLPEVGSVMISDITAEIPSTYFYYLTTDGYVYGYADAFLAAAIGLPEGWINLIEMGQVQMITSVEESADIETYCCLLTKQPKTRVYVPMPDNTFLELTSGVRTRFDEYSGAVSITEM